MARQARQSRPQLVCILADNSGSMAGEKARAATQGVREMLMECQARGPAGPERSYFRLLLIRFGDRAAVDPECDLRPVRAIDPDRIEIRGDGGSTNITEALQLTLNRLEPYLRDLERHPERAEHPLPLVLLFSDGEHNVGEPPQAVGEKLKQLQLDGQPIVVATAGVAVGEGRPDEIILRAIASPNCYFPITNAQALSAFISSVGSSGASRPEDVARITIL
jgi:uncharacterized protein YegL